MPVTYDESWSDSLFMGFPQHKGGFKPIQEFDKKLWLASDITKRIRQEILEELAYTTSAGIAHNKTVAKLACSANKPNGQTVVPLAYSSLAMAPVPIKEVRLLCGKIEKAFRERDHLTLGAIQNLSNEEVFEIV